MILLMASRLSTKPQSTCACFTILSCFVVSSSCSNTIITPCYTKLYIKVSLPTTQTQPTPCFLAQLTPQPRPRHLTHPNTLPQPPPFSRISHQTPLFHISVLQQPQLIDTAHNRPLRSQPLTRTSHLAKHPYLVPFLFVQVALGHHVADGGEDSFVLVDWVVFEDVVV
jgi:hypothetical protein